MDDLIKYINEFENSNKMAIFLIGDSGTGKTHLINKYIKNNNIQSYIYSILNNKDMLKDFEKHLQYNDILTKLMDIKKIVVLDNFENIYSNYPDILKTIKINTTRVPVIIIINNVIKQFLPIIKQSFIINIEKTKINKINKMITTPDDFIMDYKNLFKFYNFNYNLNDNYNFFMQESGIFPYLYQDILPKIIKKKDDATRLIPWNIHIFNKNYNNNLHIRYILTFANLTLFKKNTKIPNSLKLNYPRNITQYNIWTAKSRRNKKPRKDIYKDFFMNL